MPITHERVTLYRPVQSKGEDRELLTEKWELAARDVPADLQQIPKEESLTTLGTIDSGPVQCFFETVQNENLKPGYLIQDFSKNSYKITSDPQIFENGSLSDHIRVEAVRIPTPASLEGLS